MTQQATIQNAQQLQFHPVPSELLESSRSEDESDEARGGMAGHDEAEDAVDINLMTPERRRRPGQSLQEQ